MTSLVHTLCAQPMAIEPATFESLLLAAWRADQQRPQDVQAMFEEENRRDEPRIHLVGSTAVLPLMGMLFPKANVITRWFGGTSTELFERDFKQALGDSRIKKIVLLVDSPGGSALGNEEVAQTVMAARGEKPIETAIRGMCASAAYYIASAASRLTATHSSPVGSIGTIMYHTEYSKAFAEFGIAVNVIRHGEAKGDGNQYEPLSKKARATLQEFVDSYGDQFDQAVARQRGTDVATVKSQFGQGKVWLAEEARRRGLIDAVGALEDVIAVAGDDGPPEPPARDVHGASAETLSLSMSGLPAWLGEPASLQAQDFWKHTLTAAATAAPPANAPPATEGAQTPPLMEEETTVKISKNLKAALHLFGVLQTADVEKAQATSDEICWAAINAWFAARNQEVPEAEAEILKALKASGAGPTLKLEAAAEPLKPATVEQTVDEDGIRADERGRMQNIRSSGRLLEISEEEIDNAIASQKTFNDIYAGWQAAKAKEEQPIAPAEITGGAAQIEKFEAAATAVLFDRYQGDIIKAAEDHFPNSQLAKSAGSAQTEKPIGYADLQYAPLSHIAEHYLRASGVRVPQFASKEEVAKEALQQGGFGVRSFGSALYAGGPAFNRPGDFPNMLSNLMGKVLDAALQLADPTYPVYTKRISDRADFKPSTVLQSGQFEELDLILDGKKTDEQAMLEEAGGWLQVDRYGNKVGLTPVMVANDDLDNFMMQIASLSYAHEQTLNRLCLALVTGNVSLLDGNALYDDTNHGNDITSGGGAPSAAQAKTHRDKHLLQTGVGGRGKVRTPPSIALVPVELTDAAEQTFLTAGVLLEAAMKRPESDSNINVHRGKITPVVEPELSDASALKWYTFANPAIRAVIAHAFMQGYGAGGRRTNWFDPDSECRYYKLEGRFAAAAISHRGSVRNAGT